MERRWINIGTLFDRVEYLQNRSQAKRFPTAESYFHELYFHDYLRGQSWSQSCAPISFRAWLNYRYLLFYFGQHVEQPDLNLGGVITTLYRMFQHGYYIPDITRDSFLVEPKSGDLLLADYQFVPIGKSDSLSYKRKLSDALGANIDPLWNSQTGYVIMRPPPLSLMEFIGRMRLGVRIHLSGSHAIVQSPPLKSPNDEYPLSYPFIGKTFFNYDDWRAETESSMLVSSFDVEGRFHSRLLKIIDVVNCKHNIYEYTGDTLDKIDQRLKWDTRWWLYRGLSGLMGFINKFHIRRFVHYDIKHLNITYDEFFQLRLIDFGTAGYVDFINLYDADDQYMYAYRPVELMLLTSPGTTAEELQKLNEEAQTQNWCDNLREKYLKVVGIDDFSRYREQILSLSDERKAAVLIAGDVYGLGVVLLMSLPEQFLDELKPVLYHLLVPDLKERSLELAHRELVNIMETI